MEYNTGLLELLDNNPQAYHYVWNEWKQINPDTRLKRVTHHEVTIARDTLFTPPVPVKVPAEGLKAYLYRSLGHMFHKPEWKRKGLRDEWGAAPVIYDTDTITLKPFGWMEFGQSKYIYLGYHGETDTLYVRQ